MPTGKQLEDAGFVVNVDERFSDDVAAGVVISQDPSDGTGFAGDEISLVVSRGPEIVEIDIPDVRGWRLRDAERHLKDAGFEVDVQRSFPNRGRDRDRLVLNQEPVGGTAEPGTTITLYII
jgi:serine/threonine-protein kinase